MKLVLAGKIEIASFDSTQAYSRVLNADARFGLMNDPQRRMKVLLGCTMYHLKQNDYSKIPLNT